MSFECGEKIDNDLFDFLKETGRFYYMESLWEKFMGSLNNKYSINMEGHTFKASEIVENLLPQKEQDDLLFKFIKDYIWFKNDKNIFFKSSELESLVDLRRRAFPRDYRYEE